MASAEHLLHEAQYAFQCISFGESRDNRRNASRARSLCKKIIRRFPTSTEAHGAHAILKRLGDEAFTSKISSQHRHVSQATHHQKPPPARDPRNSFTGAADAEVLDWAGLVRWLFMLPKVVLAMIVFAGIFLFGIFGPFIFLVLIAFVLLTGPFRQMLKPAQRKELNAFVKRVNAYVDEQL